MHVLQCTVCTFILLIEASLCTDRCLQLDQSFICYCRCCFIVEMANNRVALTVKQPQKNSMHSVIDVSVHALTKPIKLVFDILVRESCYGRRLTGTNTMSFWMQSSK